MIAYSVIRRHMKRTSDRAFTLYEGSGQLPAELELGAHETVVGWYQNPPPWEKCIVFFTSSAVCVVDDGQVDRIPIEDIVGYESPKSKSEVTGVRVLTKRGSHFVRVAGVFGEDGNQKDAYSFIMVVRGLVAGKPKIVFPEEMEGENAESKP